MGRYRFRTWLRGRLPRVVAERIPKGEDCGDHEWFRIQSGLWGCYHCRQVTDISPWPSSELALRRLSAIFADVSALIEAGLLPHEIVAEWRTYEPEIQALMDELSEGPTRDQEHLRGYAVEHRGTVPVATIR